MTHCVYHLHENTGTQDGWIGVTKRLRMRLYQHRSDGRLGDTVSVSILKVGTEEECLELEAELRPEPNMGWNVAEGGWNKTTGTIGEATRINKGERKSQKTEFRKGQEAHNAGQSTYIFTDPEGYEYKVHNVTRFCKSHGLTNANMYKVIRGTRKSHKGWVAVQTGR